MGLAEGQVIEGKYSIVRMIGEGGMGAVYEGENLRIRRKVAIKVLHAGVAESTDAVSRFQREAQAAGQIGSDHIVEVIDLGVLPDGDYFMVMEFLQGESLGARLERKGRLGPRELAPVALQLLEGLSRAHGAGIIHRDLKPDNVWLVSHKAGVADFVKILDFGISKFSPVGGGEQMSMTRTGSVMGTPYYLSPEQAKGGRGVDQRSDIYAVGVILYQCVAGRVPYDAETFNELLFKIVLEAPPELREIAPDVDAAFAAIVAKAMAREPAHRFQSCAEMAEAMAEWSGVQLGAPASFVSDSTTAARAAAYGAPLVAGAGSPPMHDSHTPAPFSSTGPGPAPAAEKKRGGAVIALAALGATAAIGVVAALALSGKPAPSPQAPAAAAHASADQPAASVTHPAPSAEPATSSEPVKAAEPAASVAPPREDAPAADPKAPRPKAGDTGAKGHKGPAPADPKGAPAGVGTVKGRVFRDTL